MAKLKLTQVEVPNFCFVVVKAPTTYFDRWGNERDRKHHDFFPGPGHIQYDECSELFQNDWAYPGLAELFGWSVRDVQRLGSNHCDHRGSDGTVPCPDCGMPASLFMSAAFEYLTEHVGLQAIANRLMLPNLSNL